MSDQNIFLNYITNLILEFVDNSDELSKHTLPMFNTIFTKNVSDYVIRDDIQYFAERKDSIEAVHGLYYVNTKNQMNLIIELRDLSNVNERATNLLNLNERGTIYHEIVHAFDYSLLAEHVGEKDLRKLENNIYFLLWSEFHATYLCYKYLISKNGLSEDLHTFVNNIFDKLKSFCFGKKTVMLNQFTNLSVRAFGEYVATQEIYKEELEEFPSQLFYNSEFGDLYRYLYYHRTFDSIKDNLAEMKVYFDKLEKKSKPIYN